MTRGHVPHLDSRARAPARRELEIGADAASRFEIRDLRDSHRLRWVRMCRCQTAIYPLSVSS